MHRLAAAISKITGMSMTRVVIEARREHYEGPQSRRVGATAEELLLIAARASAHSLRGGPFIHHTEFLYDEQGLPK